MKKRRSEAKKSPEWSSRVIECPDCGCPNKPEDTRCIYCRSELSDSKQGIGRIVEYCSNYLWFRLKVPALFSSARGLAKTSFVYAVSLLFLFGGLYFVYTALQGAGFFNLFLGILLSLYGGGALVNILFKK